MRAQPAELPGFVLEVEIDDWTRVAAKRGPRKHPPPDRAAEIERQVKLMLELGAIMMLRITVKYSWYRNQGESGDSVLIFVLSIQSRPPMQDTLFL